MDRYWTSDDLHAGRCSLEQLGQLRPAESVQVVEAVVELDNSPEAMARVGVATLMRLAQQNRDLPTSLKAAMALLDRAWGRVAPPAPATLPPPPEGAMLPAPPWLDQTQRFSFQSNQPAPALDQTT